MDLSKIDMVSGSLNGVKMPIKHPTTGTTLMNGDEEMFVRLTGPYHPDYKRKDREITDARFAKRKFKLTTDGIREEQLELATVSVREWNIVIDGSTPEIKYGVVRGILASDQYAWLREQISEFIADQSNFMTQDS